MPRPGPRPYECIRRAWHSDRHQPMRGSLIREIFRIVNEFHSSATRKNKEWQEKLPIVVLKAEEIMYSKANSEVEYMDLETLWDRVNDAVNTIIRREENTETGKLLQPCIEAALNLGCTPRRASRSQRHHNSRCYLNSSTQETVSEAPIAPKISKEITHEGTSSFPSLQAVNPLCLPQFVPYYPNLVPPTTLNSWPLGPESFGSMARERPASHELQLPLPMSTLGFPVCSESCVPVAHDNSLFSGRLYPIYYSPNRQIAMPQFAFQNLRASNPNTSMEAKTRCLHNLAACNKALDARNTAVQASCNDGAAPDSPPDAGYDLSLRLGPSSSPSLSAENSWACEVEDMGSSNSRVGNRSYDVPPSKMRVGSFDDLSLSRLRDNKGFCFSPLGNGDDLLEPGSSKWSPEGEGLNVVESARKRKAPMNIRVDDGLFCVQPKPLTDWFSDV